MSRVLPVSLAIQTLRGTWRASRPTISKAEAVRILEAATEQRFGADVEAWNVWLKQNRWAYGSRRASNNLARNLQIQNLKTDFPRADGAENRPLTSDPE
jgi:hypothetical protein